MHSMRRLSPVATLSSLLMLSLTTGVAQAQAFNLACVYAHPGGAWKVDSGCAQRIEGRLRIAPPVLQRMTYDENGLSVMSLDRRWYYVKNNGDSLEVLYFDNGADYFSEGLTRSPIGGKVAYYDVAFNLVIAPRYDWGGPFEDGRALVCQGCRPKREIHEEHVAMVGGRWGYIDRTGKEIVPLTKKRP